MKLIKYLIITVATLPLAAMASNIKLINDTGSKQSIHTGSGFVTLNKGSSTSFSCKKGKEVRKAKSGSKKEVIFKIQSKHCGKTVKLSDVM
ncbi:hypothetical protein [Kangiella sp. HZ709]|uniref:hypothetical protein n=1 Tax=Kangiella sp. HZ709 TaxID=2666328 RepID=UPI0012AFE18D|nr:hypothetical protein [Kangiella sp. HZ709]MRX27445.1 hypothetical protein [Kangiella sp. HZ709]